MKLLLLLLLIFTISIESIQSEKPFRTYIVKRDNPIKRNLLSDYTVYDSQGSKPLYRLKPVLTNIDTIIVTPSQQNVTVANMQGEWIDNIFNVIISTRDNTLNKSMEGIIRKNSSEYRDQYTVLWNGKYLKTKTKFWSSALQVYAMYSKEVLAEMKKKRTLKSNKNIQYELKIYSNQFPDMIYLFLIAIDDHRQQMSEIKWTRPKNQVLRTYTIKRDNPVKRNVLSTYTIFDSKGVNSLYRLKPTSTDIDTIVVIRLPQNDMIANMEGEWAENTFNITFSLYDKASNKWTDGIIRKDPDYDINKYSVVWNGKYLNTKSKYEVGDIQLFDIRSLELVAEIQKRTAWFGTNVRFELKIYSNQYPDIIYFLLAAINDHRYQIFTTDA